MRSLCTPPTPPFLRETHSSPASILKRSSWTASRHLRFSSSIRAFLSSPLTAHPANFSWYSSLFSIYFLIHWNTKSKLFLSLHSFSDLLDFSLPCRDIWNSLAAAGSSHRQPSPPLHRLYSLFLLPQTVWGNWLSLLTAYLGNAIPLPSLLVVSTQLSLNSLHASSTDTHTWTCNFRCYMVGLSKDHAQ